MIKFHLKIIFLIHVAKLHSLQKYCNFNNTYTCIIQVQNTWCFLFELIHHRPKIQQERPTQIHKKKDTSAQ